MTKTPEIQRHDSNCKYRLIVERDSAEEKLAALEKSIADMSHPNIAEVLDQLAQARADDDRNNQLMVELMRQRDELLAALVAEEAWRNEEDHEKVDELRIVVARLRTAAIAAVKG